MNYGHHRVHHLMPTVTFTDEDMLLRSLGTYNDSRQKPGVQPPEMKLLDEDGEFYFKARYGIDSDHVRQVYAAS